MSAGILDLASEDRCLSVVRGFACIRDHQGEIGRVVLDDLAAVLLTARQVTVTGPAIQALMERGIPLVSCGHNYHPDGIMLPCGSHYRHAGVLAAQIALSVPRRKRIWQQVVQAKIDHQAMVLQKWRAPTTVLAEMAAFRQRVKSGDPENMEAQAARLYWRTLMGEAFRRDQDAPGINSCLNYGYAVVRAAAARSVVAAGLTPALGIHHGSAGNSFALVDDLMEPYRPMVDDRVCRMLDSGLLARDLPARESPAEAETVLTPKVKKVLVAALLQDCAGPTGLSSLVNALHSLACSLVTVLGDRNASLFIPAMLLDGDR